MKTLFAIVTACATLLAAGCASVSKPAVTASLPCKAGDTIYVCPSSACDFHTVALKPGKCGCGGDLAKVVVTDVKDQVASFQLDGKPRTAKLTGNYMCGCGGNCCQMISDKPGQCCCGKDLVAAGK